MGGQNRAQIARNQVFKDKIVVGPPPPRHEILNPPLSI